MHVIKVKLLIEDVMNPSDGDAKEFVTQIICEAFGKEERQEFPRCKLVLIEVEYPKELK